MIKGNIIEFGYGDVLVSSDWYKECITVTNIEPPLECGVTVYEYTAGIEFGESVEIYEDELHDLYRLMHTVSNKNRVVHYKEWTFDFTEYNEESVRVMTDKAWNIINPMWLAC